MSCLRTGGRLWPLLGPNVTAVAQASPWPCLRPPSPARAPHRLWILRGAPRCSCSRHSGSPGGPRPRFRRHRAGLSYSRAGCHGSVAGGSAGARSPPLTGIPAHSLPIFGPRSRGCPGASRRPRALRALADGTTRTAGWDAPSLGARTMLREGAAALFRPLVMQALRRASARSDGSHILESAELAFVAAAPRMPPGSCDAWDSARRKSKGNIEGFERVILKDSQWALC